MEYRKPVLKWRDYLNVTLRSYHLQSGFNYNNYQGIGYANVILPALKKIYSGNEDMIKKAAVENIDFYNCNPHLNPFVTSVQLALLDGGSSPEDARSMKMALMGPLSGIGDSLFQFGLAPLFSSIGAGLAADGSVLGPILFFILMNLTIIITRIFSGFYGYKLGTSFVETLSEKMAAVSRLSSIIGITVVSGLAVTFVKLSIPLKYVSKMPDGKLQEIAVQSILDKIMPKLLPGVFTLIMLYLIRKRKWNTYKLIALTLVIGILGSYLGIIG